MTHPMKLSRFNRFSRLFALGVVGIVSYLPSLSGTLRALVEKFPDKPHPPMAVLLLLSLLQSALLLAVMIVLGLWLAPRLGLKSRVLGQVQTPFRQDVPAALLGSVLSISLVAAVYLAFKPAAQALQQEVNRDVLYTLMGMLYGGLTEELLVRFGIMTALAALFHLLFRNLPFAMGLSILLSSVIFGALHLPYAATLTALTPQVVAFVVLGNSVAGMVFGVLFWKRNLETAMLAHMGFHVLLSLITWAGWLQA
jgi:membrane protease YdiL (CAAX protease family)